MSLSSIPIYWLNLVLHATALGLVAWLAVLCLRHPRTRATAAGIGLIAIGFLPWLSALRTPEAPMPSVLKAPAQALPTWKITLQESAPEAPPAAAPIARVEAPPSEPARLPSFRPWQILAALWLAGTSLCLFLDTRTALRLRSWRKSQASPTDAEWDTLAPLTRMGRRSVLLNDVAISPCVVGVFTPRLILPRFLLAKPEHPRLLWALRHEAEHLRGHDLRWLAAFRLIRAIFWWNPFVHRLIARWSEAREQICDLHATPTPEERASYSEFLIALSSRPTRRQPGTLAMADRGPVARLKRRLVFLLTSPADRPLGKSFMPAALLLLLICGATLPSFGVNSGSANQTPPADDITLAPLSHDPSVTPVYEIDPEGEDGILPQVKISNRLIFSTQPLAAAGEIISEEELSAMVRAPGSRLETMPSVTARAQQGATIEIIRDDPANAPPPPTQEELDRDDLDLKKRLRVDHLGNPDRKFLGFVMNLIPEAQADHLHLRTHLAYSFIPGRITPFDNAPEPGAIPWTKLRRVDAKFDGNLKPGQIIAVTFGEIEEGTYLTAFISAIPTDGAGFLVERFDQRLPDRRTKPANPAPNIRFKGILFDTPQGSKDMLSFSSREPVALLNSEQMEEFRQSAPVRGHDLSAIDLLSGAPRTALWKDEVPRFWLEATASANLATIDLVYRSTSYPGKEPAKWGVVTSLTVYDGYALGINLDPPPGIQQRVLVLQANIEKSKSGEEK